MAGRLGFDFGGPRRMLENVVFAILNIVRKSVHKLFVLVTYSSQYTD